MESKQQHQTIPPLNLPAAILARIPQGDIFQSTLNLAWTTLSEPIFNHSLRVYLLAQWLAQKEGAADYESNEKQSLLFAACLCHDLGTCDQFNGPQRFEVEGADAAKTHLLSHSFSEQESHQVWTAIALHTSPGIAERIDPLTRLVRLAVLMDFSLDTRTKLGGTKYAAEIETYLPRIDIEKSLADAVVCQSSELSRQQRPDNLTWPTSQKHPKGSWPGLLFHAHLLHPDHQGVNPAF